MDRINDSGKPMSRHGDKVRHRSVLIKNEEGTFRRKVVLPDKVKAFLRFMLSPELEQCFSDYYLALEKSWSVRRLWSTELLKNLKQHKNSDFRLFSKIILQRSIAELAGLEFDYMNPGYLLYVKTVIGKHNYVTLMAPEYHVSGNYEDRSSHRYYMVTFRGQLAACIGHNVQEKDILAIWGTPRAKKYLGGTIIQADSTEHDSINVVIFRPTNASRKSLLEPAIQKIEMDGVEEFEVTTKETGAKSGYIEIKYTPLPSVVSTVASELTIRDEIEDSDSDIDLFYDDDSSSCLSDSEGSTDEETWSSDSSTMFPNPMYSATIF